jgi:hypothetical protein
MTLREDIDFELGFYLSQRATVGEIEVRYKILADPFEHGRRLEGARRSRRPRPPFSHPEPRYVRERNVRAELRRINALAKDLAARLERLDWYELDYSDRAAGHLVHVAPSDRRRAGERRYVLGRLDDEVEAFVDVDACPQVLRALAYGSSVAERRLWIEGRKAGEPFHHFVRGLAELFTARTGREATITWDDVGRYYKGDFLTLVDILVQQLPCHFTWYVWQTSPRALGQQVKRALRRRKGHHVLARRTT